MAENFPELLKKITWWIEEALWASSNTPIKKATLGYILVQLWKTKTIFKAGRKNRDNTFKNEAVRLIAAF